MKNKSFRIPMGMLTRKFYCDKCGERLIRNARTRTIKRGDPDYKEHSRVGRTHLIGDVEFTEYDFKCPACGKIIGYEEQCVIEKIQKYVNRHTLSETEITENIEKAKAALARKRKITNIIVKIFAIAIIALVAYMVIRSGDFSFKFYF